MFREGGRASGDARAATGAERRATGDIARAFAAANGG
jgi:hypothetical protein